MVPSIWSYFIERPLKELLVGMHLGPGIQGQTLALEAVSCPPHRSSCSVSPVIFIFLSCQTLKDVIQIPLFELLKWLKWWLWGCRGVPEAQLLWPKEAVRGCCGVRIRVWGHAHVCWRAHSLTLWGLQNELLGVCTSFLYLFWAVLLLLAKGIVWPGGKPV